MRHYIRKTQRAMYPDGYILKAVKEVVAEKKKVCVVSKETSIPKRSLLRYVKNFLAAGIQDEAELTRIIGGYKKHRKVFSHEQERNLSNYVKRASDIHHRFTTTDLRRLAYQYAKQEKCIVPLSWSVKQEAGRDWLYGFMRRQRDLSNRKPRATSLSRATSFNKHNVDSFFDNVEVIRARGIPPSRWFNAGWLQSGFTTVCVPDGSIAQKGRKQIGPITSGERGTLVTICLAVSATGMSIPPFIVFPRVHFKEYFLHGAPLGSAGSANKSGLMSEKDFILFMKHFIQHVRPSKESEVVLFLDNHSSHLSIEVLNLAKDNGVVMLTFPPHCSHKLQPLDRSVFGPFKIYYNSYCSSWMKGNPGRPVSIHNIAELVGLAFPLATTPANITSGFRVTGLVPFNRFIFDVYFAPSFVTDRPFNSSPVAPDDDGFIEIPASNDDNIVQDGQTPVPANHITDDVSTAILPDLNNIVGIFEEDPLTIVQNVNISLDVQNGETFDLRGVIKEDSNRNPVETVRPYPEAPPELTTKRGRGRPSKASRSVLANILTRRNSNSSSVTPPKKNRLSHEMSITSVVESRGDVENSEKENVTNDIQKKDVKSVARRGRGRPPKASISQKTTIEKSPVAIVATRPTRKTTKLTPLERKMKCCNVVLERDPEIEALCIAMMNSEGKRKKVDAATSQVEIPVAARVTRGMLKFGSKSEPDSKEISPLSPRTKRFHQI